MYIGIGICWSSQAAAFEQTRQVYGGIDIVLNNAGIGNEFQWKKMVAINLVRALRISIQGNRLAHIHVPIM